MRERQGSLLFEGLSGRFCELWPSVEDCVGELVSSCVASANCCQEGNKRTPRKCEIACANEEGPVLFIRPVSALISTVQLSTLVFDGATTFPPLSLFVIFRRMHARDRSPHMALFRSARSSVCLHPALPHPSTCSHMPQIIQAGYNCTKLPCATPWCVLHRGQGGSRLLAQITLWSIVPRQGNN